MKKTIVLWCSVFTLLVCLLTGCGKSLEEQIAEQLELGQRYLTKLNYEEAIVAFTKAIELDEKNVDAYIGRGQVYEAMAQAAGEESTDGTAYYQQAAGEYEQALSLSPADSAIRERLIQIYQSINDLERIKKLTEVDTSVISDETILNRMENIKTALETIEEISNVCEAGEIDQVFELMQSDEFEILEQFAKEMDHPICQVENGKGIGVYLLDSFYECMIYYGDYQDGQRHGYGLWIGDNIEASYLAEGEWRDDVPNGSQEMREWSHVGEEAGWYYGTIGTVQNGLWHGDAMDIDGYGAESPVYKAPVSFKHGKYVVLKVEEDSEGTWYVISVDEEGRSYVTIDDPNIIWGIEGFY